MKNPTKFYDALAEDCKPSTPSGTNDRVANLVAGMERRLAEKIDAANKQFTEKIDAMNQSTENAPIENLKETDDLNDNEKEGEKEDE